MNFRPTGKKDLEINRVLYRLSEIKGKLCMMDRHEISCKEFSLLTFYRGNQIGWLENRLDRTLFGLEIHIQGVVLHRPRLHFDSNSGAKHQIIDQKGKKMIFEGEVLPLLEN